MGVGFRYWKLHAKAFRPQSNQLRAYIVQMARPIPVRNITRFYCHAIREGVPEEDGLTCHSPANRDEQFASTFRKLVRKDLGEELEVEED